MTALSGDGQLLTYSLAPSATRRDVDVGLVRARGAVRAIAAPRDRTLALSADAGRVAALGSSGLVTLSAPGNRSLGRIDVGRARAIALHGSTLVAVSRGQLKVFDALKPASSSTR